VTSQDEVTGSDGRHYVSDQSTIWRWRKTFQNDFAARMSWTVQDYAHANHNPVLTVNGQEPNQSFWIWPWEKRWRWMPVKAWTPTDELSNTTGFNTPKQNPWRQAWLR
jgi:hypothetical protein